MKSKITKILGVVLSLALLSSMAMIAVPVSAAGSATVVNKWEALGLPSTFVDSDVEIITQAEDGTFFISVLYYDDGVLSGLTPGDYYGMWKSADGYAWVKTCIMGESNRITAIEASDNYSVDKTVYVAVDTSTYTTIYRCTGAAATTVIPGEMGQISAGASGTKEATIVYSIDSYYDDDDVWLLVATDIDVFAIPDDNGLTTVWTDMELSQTLGGAYVDVGPAGGVVVYKAMFAPYYSSTGVVWAVYWDQFASPYIDGIFSASVSNTNGYGIIARSSGSTLWGTTITPVIVKDTVSGFSAKSECDIEFAADYSSSSVAPTSANMYAALSFLGYTADDDIYSIECGFYGDPGTVTPFDVDPGTAATDTIDFCSLEVSGNLLVAGSYDQSGAFTGTEVWVSLNDGITWNIASKNPTGEASHTCNLLISDTGAIFAATGGDQSAISVSEDNGDTWNQIAFIDTVISSIDDLAFDPTGTAAAMITSDTTDSTFSLWKTGNVNAASPQWQRTLCTTYSTVIAEFTMVEYSMDGTVAMLYDASIDEIYRSVDDLQTFAPWRSTTSWGDINDWVVYDSSSVYAACVNGFWSTAVVGSSLAGAELVSVEIQPGFDPDDADADVIIVGGKTADAISQGKAYVSYDAGDNFEAGVAVNIDTYVANLDVYVAFDAEYEDNGMVYFALGEYVGYGVLDDDGTFYHNVAGVATTGCSALKSVTALNGNHPVMGVYVDIEVSGDNTLYALDVIGHMARYLLNDKDAGGFQSDWDLVDNAAATPPATDELWITPGSNVAWTIDSSTNNCVWLLDDILTKAVSGITVTNIGPFSCTVKWNAMTGATDYEVIFYSYNEVTDDWDTDGSIFTDETTIDSIEWYLMGLSDATDYMVSVRVNNDGVPTASTSAYMYEAVELSRWGSNDFTTLYYMSMPMPTNPSQGLDEVSLSPSFGWSSVTNAVTYKFQLSDDPTFNTLIDEVSVTVTAYTYKGDGLDYNNDYFWRVQAVGPDSAVSNWSVYTENFFAVTLEEFVAGWSEDLIDAYTYGFFRDGDMLFYWNSGAISNFHTESEAIPPVTVEPAPTPTIILPTPVVNVPEFVMPDIIVNPPAMTINLPTPTVTEVNPVIEMPVEDTPVYIWLIVAIGALLTIAVIILIIRTRRVV